MPRGTMRRNVAPPFPSRTPFEGAASAGSSAVECSVALACSVPAPFVVGIASASV